METIPTIDVSALAHPERTAYRTTVQQILDACTGIGFLSITGTGVSREAVDKVRTAARKIFGIDTAPRGQPIR